MWTTFPRFTDYFYMVCKNFFFVKEILKERACGRGKLNRLNTGLASPQHIHNILQEPDMSYDEIRKKKQKCRRVES